MGDTVRALRFILRREQIDKRIYNVLSENLTVREDLNVFREMVPELEVIFVDSTIMNQPSYTVRNDWFGTPGFEFRGQLHAVLKETGALIRNARHG